jgi:hypothetical protein
LQSFARCPHATPLSIIRDLACPSSLPKLFLVVPKKNLPSARPLGVQVQYKALWSLYYPAACLQREVVPFHRAGLFAQITWEPLWCLALVASASLTFSVPRFRSDGGRNEGNFHASCHLTRPWGWAKLTLKYVKDLIRSV